MTTFTKDLQLVKQGFEKEVIIRRRDELKKLEHEGKTCKNKFRLQCIVQDFKRLQRELNIIESLF